jgi:methionyl-tRNA formyltransferase
VRCAFLGSPAAAVPTLRALVDAGHDVDLVISRADARRGRGGRIAPTPVKDAATELGLRVSADLVDLAGVQPEVAIVVAYGRIIPASILAVAPMLNVHFSLLPRWRGAAPVERAILAGDERTGVCVMELEATLDTGPVLSRSEVLIGDRHAGELTAELAEIGASLLVSTIATVPWPEAEPQRGDPTYAARLTAADFALDPSQAATHLARVVQLDRATALIGGHLVRVRRATARNGGGPAGSVLVAGDQVALVCADGHLVLDHVTAAGAAPTSAIAWWRGARLDDTATWTSPTVARS